MLAWKIDVKNVNDDDDDIYQSINTLFILGYKLKMYTKVIY